MPTPQNLERLAARVLIAGFHGTSAHPAVLSLLEQGLGGVILFKRNIESERACADLLDELRTPGPCLLAVDQEGGRVARLRERVIALPPMRRLGELDDVQLTRECGRVLGEQLKEIGFNLDFAPVLDVDTNPANPVIGDRSFAREVKTVVRHAMAFGDGLARAGILACGKHFPGHGDTLLDSHLALPTVDHDEERLRAVELAAFAQATALPTMMTAHVVFPAFDPKTPATLSPQIISILRDEFGYEGVIISDDLEMKAVAETYGVAESAMRAIEAGCDALLVCSDLAELYDAHAALVARATHDTHFAQRLEQSAKRVERLIAKTHSHTGRRGAALERWLDEHQAARELIARLEAQRKR